MQGSLTAGGEGRTTRRGLIFGPFLPFALVSRAEKKELITWLGDKQERMEREVEEILKKREKVRAPRFLVSSRLMLRESPRRILD